MTALVVVVPAPGVATLSETVETLQKERFYQAGLYTNGDTKEAQRRLRYLHRLELPSKLEV